MLETHDQFLAAIVCAMATVLQAALDRAGAHRTRAAVAYAAAVAEAAVAYTVLSYKR